MSLLRYVSLAALVAAAACTRTQTTVETSSPATGRAENVRSAQALDVPAVVGRNIDQVRRAWGAPRETREQKIGLEPTAEQLKATRGEDWINTFEKDGTTIVVTFNARTRKVRDLVLMGSDEDELLRRGNLSLTAPEYQVLPVANPQNDREQIGVRVVAR